MNNWTKFNFLIVLPALLLPQACKPSSSSEETRLQSVTLNDMNEAISLDKSDNPTPNSVVQTNTLPNIPLSETEIRIDTKNVVFYGTGKTNNCNKDSITVVQAGESFSLVFTNIGIDFSATNNLNEIKDINNRCFIIMPIKIPAGYYIETINHTLGTGIAKNKGTTALIRSNINFLFTRNYINIEKLNSSFEETEALTYTDNSQPLSMPGKYIQCYSTRKSHTYLFSYDLTTYGKRQIINGEYEGKKTSYLPSMTLDVDGVDVQFEMNSCDNIK